jgi:hypothetical protein
MKPSAELRQLRREIKQLRMKLSLAENLIGILRRVFITGEEPAVEPDLASARAGARPAAGKSRRLEAP